MNLTLRKIIGTGAALALLAGPAMAQQGPSPYGQHGPQGMQHPGPAPRPAPPPHQAYAPPHGGWHQGDHYNGGRQAVDWRHHHLRQPPSGYEWVQSGNQFVLIAVTTGIIASIIAGAQ